MKSSQTILTIMFGTMGLFAQADAFAYTTLEDHIVSPPKEVEAVILRVNGEAGPYQNPWFFVYQCKSELKPDALDPDRSPVMMTEPLCKLRTDGDKANNEGYSLNQDHLLPQGKYLIFYSGGWAKYIDLNSYQEIQLEKIIYKQDRGPVEARVFRDLTQESQRKRLLIQLQASSLININIKLESYCTNFGHDDQTIRGIGMTAKHYCELFFQTPLSDTQTLRVWKFDITNENPIGPVWGTSFDLHRGNLDWWTQWAFIESPVISTKEHKETFLKDGEFVSVLPSSGHYGVEYLNTKTKARVYQLGIQLSTR